MKDLFKREPSVQELREAYGRLHYDGELWRLELHHEMYLHDRASAIASAERRGFAQGRAKLILHILNNRFQAVPKPLEEQILAIAALNRRHFGDVDKDLECLEKLGDFAFDCKSLNEFAAAVE